MMWIRFLGGVLSRTLLQLKGRRFLPSRHLQTWDVLRDGPMERFRNLALAPDHCFLTYVWIDGTGINLRAKTKVASSVPNSIKDLSAWHFDGSSTYQATSTDSDMTLNPCAICKDPFLPGNAKLVLCDVRDRDNNPAATNHRMKCLETLEKTERTEPWFGLEQEYTLQGRDHMPLGFPVHGLPDPQGPYYCSIGAGNSAGRDISDAHLIACCFAGLKIGGTNAEVLLGQWEYQIGPCEGVEVADQLWLSRFILSRLAEEFGVSVTLDPKPVAGDWNGTGNHCNFSTNQMRADGGVQHMWNAIKKLEKYHTEHIAVYDAKGGDDNKRRLTGRHETASIDEFSAAEGSRSVSIRIPTPVVRAGKGWIEDRRPSANCDPYLVIERIMRTVFLEP